MGQNFFGKADRILGVALRGASSFCIAGLWIIVTAIVLFRSVPIFPMGWTDEIVELLFAWMVFIGAAELCRQKKHFIVDLIPNMIAGTRAGQILGIVVQLLAAAFLLVFTYEGALLAIQATDRSPVFEYPKILWYMSIPISGVIMVGYTLRELWALFKNPS
ncbi:MAG TPA: TRAP transporter small permease subunit [Thermodesulfobacteriota bacterium]|nr:TRAP transporter small permease subunit [Thermodesulfobacteriota bacterium]